VPNTIFPALVASPISPITLVLIIINSPFIEIKVFSHFTP